MDIGNVLSRAWQIIWKHKVLWIFGILAGCSGGGGGSGNGFRSSYRGNLPQQWEPFAQQFQNIPQWQIAIIVGVIILIILFLVVVGIFLSTIGRIGLVRGTQQAESGAASLTFGELFSGSMPYFWRVFGLNLVVGLAVSIIAILIALMAVLGTVATLGLGLFCIIPLVCVLVPVLWFVGVIVEQASIAIVMENLGIMDGLRRGWEVVRANLGTMIVMALILVLGVGGIGGFIIALPVALIVLPALIGVAINEGRVTGGSLVLAGVCFIAYLPVLLVLSGILRSYIESAWTLTFMRLTAKPVAPTEPVEPAAPTELPPAAEAM
jgi:hypothetical protein